MLFLPSLFFGMGVRQKTIKPNVRANYSQPRPEFAKIESVTKESIAEQSEMRCVLSRNTSYLTLSRPGRFTKKFQILVRKAFKIRVCP